MLGLVAVFAVVFVVLLVLFADEVWRVVAPPLWVPRRAVPLILVVCLVGGTLSLAAAVERSDLVLVTDNPDEFY